MKEPLDIVISPMVTEKGTDQKEKDNKYQFKVSADANKIEIKRAIESIYKVKVAEVNTMVVRGKSTRWRRIWGKLPDWKKAVVTLKEGESIEFI